MSDDRPADPLLTQLLAAGRAARVAAAGKAMLEAGNDTERQAMAQSLMSAATGTPNTYSERAAGPYYSRCTGDFGQPGHVGDAKAGGGREDD